MSYHANPSEFTAVFAVPTALTDKYIRLSDGMQLKVLLLALRHNPLCIVPQELANSLSLTVDDVTDALNYWAECGVLINDGEAQDKEKILTEEPAKENLPIKTEETKTRKIIRAEIVKPTREEVARRGAESAEITFMLREAQMKLGRPLKTSETATFVWLYDDEGLSVPIILQLITFAVAEGKPNIGFIERTAISWINDGVRTVSDAEQKIAMHHEKKSAWYAVERALGIEHRMPSAKETELAYTWMCKYKFDSAILRRAYDLCVDTTSKFSMPYIKKILDSWHKNGVKKVEDIDTLGDKKQKKKSKKSGSMATYDMELYKSQLEKLPE